jgi:hypothetical protein
MRLVRSDEIPEGGATVGLGALRALAIDWYGDRLDPNWRPRTVDESQAILGRHGLDGPFWSLTAAPAT